MIAMMTWIIAIITFAVIGWAVYRQWFSKTKAAHCADCADVGCPLYDQAKVIRENNQKRA